MFPPAPLDLGSMFCLMRWPHVTNLAAPCCGSMSAVWQHLAFLSLSLRSPFSPVNQLLSPLLPQEVS